MRFLTAISLVVIGFFSAGLASAADSLYSDFSRKGIVKAFVMDPSDTTTNKKIEPSVLKKLIEEALTNRKSLKFELAPSRDAADIAVETEVVEYYWTNHDPVDMIVGLGGTAYDALRVENYARIQAVFSVKDTKAGRLLWKEKLQGTITDAAMHESEGPKRVGEKLAQQFMIEAFGKKKGRR